MHETRKLRGGNNVARSYPISNPLVAGSNPAGRAFLLRSNAAGQRAHSSPLLSQFSCLKCTLDVTFSIAASISKVEKGLMKSHAV